MIKSKNAHFDIAIDAFDQATIICLKCMIICMLMTKKMVTDLAVLVTKASILGQTGRSKRLKLDVRRNWTAL